MITAAPPPVSDSRSSSRAVSGTLGARSPASPGVTGDWRSSAPVIEDRTDRHQRLARARGAWRRGHEGADDPENRKDDPDPEHHVMAPAERARPEVDPTRHVHDRQQDPQKSRHVTPPPFRSVPAGTRPWLVVLS